MFRVRIMTAGCVFLELALGLGETGLVGEALALAAGVGAGVGVGEVDPIGEVLAVGVGIGVSP